MKSNVLELFYNYVAKEALTGRVDCYFKYNILFNTKIIQDNIEMITDIDKDSNLENSDFDLFVPTLLIKNKKEFDYLLTEYVKKALTFYDDDNFCEEVLDSDFLTDENGISKEKVILTLLWSNATVEDFNDPCSYLRKRIAFFELGNFAKYLNCGNLGYSEVLNANIMVNIEKNRLENETPYSLKLFLTDYDNNEVIFEFPRVYLGIYDGKGYVYAIQNSKDRFIREDRIKKIERKFYGINSNFDVKEDTEENYGFGNLKDVTPSFLIAANIVIGMFRQIDIKNVFVPSILISRWNGKILTYKYMQERLKLKDISEEEKDKILDEYYLKSLMIQSHLTEKYLRLFRRLGYHHSTIGISSFPMEVSSDLVLNIYDGRDVCNNSLLDETYSFGKSNNKLK